MRDAEVASRASHDPHTKNGCVLVLLGGRTVIPGTNRFLRGVKMTPERLERPEKYKWIEHAERDAIYAAALAGASLLHATAYLLFAPCMDCARALAGVGVKRIVVSRTHNDAKLAKPETAAKWTKELEDARVLLAEAGVQFVWWSQDTGHQLA